ncbi:FISUMP domain-containing protein [Dysgonomonas sp. HGC4]|uniref:FISUMP domain-containing protein n=1 Tax=Dysgonomonas sp. HGC4 TaxID=1658009 RepID=UPI000681B404|nr:FISUMP domain-containing protein [Dysgonomonas sp. HGC4]MBD8347882.1 hypothetical protein [Dysgonomonas sp. HGC4]
MKLTIRDIYNIKNIRFRIKNEKSGPRLKLYVLLAGFIFTWAHPGFSQMPESTHAAGVDCPRYLFRTDNGLYMSGVQVGGIWWSPVNLGASLLKKPENSANDELFFGKVFVWPIKDPCPQNWRMPTALELKQLEKAVRERGRDFDYEGKCLRISADNGKSKLILPAGGSLGLGGNRQSMGLVGGYWSSSVMKNNADFATRLYFHGSSLDLGVSDRRIGFSIRCVSANKSPVVNK